MVLPAIIITVYDRREHVQRCLESLERAKGADRFHVVIGSDAPLYDKHVDKIAEVRTYLTHKAQNNKFHKISLIYHLVNNGPRGNVEACHSLAKDSGCTSFIRMEDDVVVGYHFLEFMLHSLELYREVDDVIGINGYLDPDINPIRRSPFLLNKFCAYGYASWYAKWDNVLRRRDATNYAAWVLSDRKLFSKQARLSTHAKSYPFLAERFYEAADLELGLMMETEKLWVIRPHKSLTANKGMDGSGLHSGVSVHLQKMEPSNEEMQIPSPANIERIELADVKTVISYKNRYTNWAVFFIYRYLPYGFELLKWLRSVKQTAS